MRPYRGEGVESTLFQSQGSDYWTEKEKDEFFAHIAFNPEAGDVVPKSGGVRKIRWSRPGMGKRSGSRVIYFNHVMQQPKIWLIGQEESPQHEPTHPT